MTRSFIYCKWVLSHVGAYYDMNIVEKVIAHLGDAVIDTTDKKTIKQFKNKVSNKIFSICFQVNWQNDDLLSYGHLITLLQYEDSVIFSWLFCSVVCIMLLLVFYWYLPGSLSVLLFNLKLNMIW